ncbi:SRPBCC family protein [Bacteroidia bacterium]|nr:SRPBCC family protein [Bacteroidia bacterium]
MPKTHISKSIVIESTREHIYSILSNFYSWKTWSPWLICEPEVRLRISNDGKYYEWSGEGLGSGNMKITDEKEFQISYDLNFLKPWKSKSKTIFLLSQKGDQVEVTWTMDGSLPFFMFFMKKMMERLVGMDYERGLLMLKGYCEKGKVDASLEFLGESQYKGCSYLGIKNSSSLDNMPEVMGADFEKLTEFALKNSNLVSSEFFSIYHKFAFGKNKADFTSAVKLKGEPVAANLPEGLFIDSLPETVLYTVRHKGTYKLIGNAWSAITAMQRAKEFKCNKRMHPMEFYRNSPRDVAPHELVSDVCMPIE